MMNAMSWCFFVLTLVSIGVACWAVENSNTDTAISATLGALIFSMSIFAAAKF